VTRRWRTRGVARYRTSPRGLRLFCGVPRTEPTRFVLAPIHEATSSGRTPPCSSSTQSPSSEIPPTTRRSTCQCQRDCDRSDGTIRSFADLLASITTRPVDVRSRAAEPRTIGTTAILVALARAFSVSYTHRRLSHPRSPRGLTRVIGTLPIRLCPSSVEIAASPKRSCKTRLFVLAGQI